MLDQRDHPPDRFGIDGAFLQLAQLIQRAPVPHQRQPRPIGKVGEIAAGNLKHLAERSVMTALTDQRQHEMIDDMPVEAVPRDADAGGSQRHAPPRRTRFGHPHH